MATGKLRKKSGARVIGKGKLVKKKPRQPDTKKRTDRYALNSLLKKRT